MYEVAFLAKLVINKILLLVINISPQILNTRFFKFPHQFLEILFYIIVIAWGPD